MKDAEYYQIDELVKVLHEEQRGFDRTGGNIQLLNDNTTIRNTSSGHAYALSKKGNHSTLPIIFSGIKTGTFTWKVRTDNFSQPSHWIAIGIAHGPGSYADSYCISSANQTWGSNSQNSNVSGDWKNGDLIEVRLDCDNSVLEVVNTRTARSQRWNLPKDGKEWFLYVNMYNAGDQSTLAN